MTLVIDMFAAYGAANALFWSWATWRFIRRVAVPRYVAYVDNRRKNAG